MLARSERIDAHRLDRAHDATHTTSPTAAILASIDASRALLASVEGRLLLDELAARVARARATLRAAAVPVLGLDDPVPGQLDPAKLVLSLRGSSLSGIELEDALLADGIAVEMADRDTLVALVGLTDDDATLGRLVTTILTASAHRPPAPASPQPAPPPPAHPPQRLTPREAFLAEHESVTRAQALGRIAAELVAPYPPGIPVLVPGEEVTAEALAHLDAHRAAGTRIAYAADPTLATFQVVAT